MKTRIKKILNGVGKKPSVDPIAKMELYGLSQVPVLSYEPDPDSFHGDFYYNSKSNTMFRKIKGPMVEKVQLYNWSLV